METVERPESCASPRWIEWGEEGESTKEAEKDCALSTGGPGECGILGTSEESI